MQPERDEGPREALIRSFLPMVRRMATRIHRLVPAIAVEDLIGDGCIGIIRAVDGYDPLRGTSLELYARRLALGKMLNGVRRMDPVSERARRELRDAERERFEIANRTGALPTRAEMEALRPGLAHARQRAYALGPLSLDGPLPRGLDLPLDVAADPAVVCERREARAALRAQIRALPDRQRRIVAQHYYGERSMREIGRGWRISSQRVSQLHRKALRALEAARAAQD